MYTSYEQRLEFLHQFIDGSLAYHKNLPNAKLTKGDGWQLYSAGLGFEVGEESHGLIISLLWVVLCFLQVAAQRSTVQSV
jgi:hypothetical protein